MAFGLRYNWNEKNIPIKLQTSGFEFAWMLTGPTWRNIPVSKWLVTRIYKPLRPFIKGITPFRGLTNHGYYPLTNWDNPPSKDPGMS